MKIVRRIRHLYYRTRVAINKKYYPVFLKKQGVRIGEGSVINHPFHLDWRLPYLLEIGSRVVISSNVTILTHDATTAYAGDMVKIGRVRILDNSFIGANSTLLCHVKIGPNSIVGAGSVVTGDVPPDCVYGGNPARLICSVEEFIRRNQASCKEVPLVLAADFGHPYIRKGLKRRLQAELDKTFGYCCGKLPK